MLMFEYRDRKHDSKEETDILEHALAQTILSSRTENLVITSADAKPLADTAVKYGEEFASQNIIPLIKRYSSDLNFVVTFLVALSESVETKRIRTEIAQTVCKEVVERLIEDVKFPTHLPSSEAYPYDWPRPHRFDYGDPLPYYGSRRKYNPKTQPDDACRFKKSSMDKSSGESFPESTHLSTLFELLEQFRLHEQRDRLINKIVGALPSADLGVIENTFLPLLSDLIIKLNGAQHDISSYTHLSQNILSAYIDAYVGGEPLEPKDWKQNELKRCAIEDCKTCPRLNNFLTSSSRQEDVFPINAQGRAHIEERLDGRHCALKLDKAKTPYTLIVLKTCAAWQYAHNEWRNRRGVAKKAILDLGEERLERMIGKDWEVKIGLAGDTASEEGSNTARKPLGEVGQGKRKRDNEDEGTQHGKHHRIFEGDEHTRGVVTRT